MNLEQFTQSIPDYAKDLRINLGSVLQQPELTAPQLWATALSCAVACRNPRLLVIVEAEAATHLDETAIGAAKTAAALMGMTNIYYRFRHLTSNEKYASMPARLRMQAIRTHGGDPVEFELCCLAVSTINGCAACVNSHEQELRAKGVGEEAILAAVRIASVIHAVAAIG